MALVKLRPILFDAEQWWPTPNTPTGNSDRFGVTYWEEYCTLHTSEGLKKIEPGDIILRGLGSAAELTLISPKLYLLIVAPQDENACELHQKVKLDALIREHD